MPININEIITLQRNLFLSNQTRPYQFRINALRKLKQAILEYEDEIIDALSKDLNKSKTESYMTEIGIVLSEINLHLKHLKKWMKPKRVKTPLMLFSQHSYIIKEPLGVSLIISPWNYPFQLALMPLVGSISAGNCAIIKPSEYSPYTSKVIEQIISNVFSEEFCKVYLGGIDVAKKLLEEKYDFIFFTGSIQTGKIIYQAASRNLTPVCLELGGKSPCIVDETADLKTASKRIAYGKFLNSGQTCVAPDYILVHRKIKNDLIKFLINSFNEFQKETDPSSLVKIISPKHLDRLLRLIENEHIAYGGKVYDNDILEPTIITNVKIDSLVMQEEIFGPILPIIPYDSLDEAIMYLQDKERPLALYMFSNNQENTRKVINNLSFGGGAINDTIMHLVNPNLPFGGVGSSGIGRYHGRYSFELFSHQKALAKKTKLFDNPFKYPPYTAKKENIIRKFLK